MDEGISTRPTTDSGRRMTDAELGMERPREIPKKPMASGIGLIPAVMAASKKAASMVGDRALVRKAARMADPRGAVMEGDKERYGKGGKVMSKKGVPAHSSKPMIRRNKGGLTAMPKGKC